MANESEKSVLDKLLDFYKAVIALKDQSEESECPVRVDVAEYRSNTSLLVTLTLLEGEQDRPVLLTHHDKSIYPSEAWIEAAKIHIGKAQGVPQKPIIVKKDPFRLKLEEAEDFLAKRKVLVEECGDVAMRLGSETGVLRQIQELQARMPYLSAENAITIWRQAPEASDVRTRFDWGKVKASVKSGQQEIYMFRQDKQYEESRSRYIEAVYDISQTTCIERWETPTSDALQHVNALARLCDINVAHYNKGYSEGKVIENRPEENVLLVNVSANKNQLVLTAAAIVADRLISKKEAVRPEERTLISTLAAQLYAIRHGFGAYDERVDNNTETQLRARHPDKRLDILETARRMAIAMSTRTEVPLEETAKEKGETSA